MADNQPENGEAVDGYHQNGEAQEQYQQQPQPYPQQPPPYGSVPDHGGQSDLKQNFGQIFKIDRPKYNDIWATVLFITVFAGFTAVSGLSIYGYSTTKLFQGGGIYNGANTVGLNTNTIVLLQVIQSIKLTHNVEYANAGSARLS